MEKQDIRLLSNDEWLAWQKQVIREEYKEKKTQNNSQKEGIKSLKKRKGEQKNERKSFSSLG